MSRRRASGWLAWGLCALVLALIGGSGVLAGANSYGAVGMFFLLPEVVAAVVGGMVAARRPKNAVGWLILAHAACFSMGEFSRQYALYGLVEEPGSLPLAGVLVSVTYWIWFPGVILVFVLLPLYFPDGRLLSARWRPAVALTVCLGALLTALAAVQPGDFETPGAANPLGMESFSLRDLGPLVPAVWLGLGLLAASSLMLRFRRSRGEERQQIKWVVYAVVLLVCWTLLEQALLLELLPVVSELAFVLTLGALWVSVAVAILRHRLYDIDVIINRTLVYGVLSLTLLAVYFGTVVLLRTTLFGWAQDTQLSIVVSTLVIAALFNPLRARVQAAVDRRFYRRKYDAEKTLAAFSARLRQETELEPLRDDLRAAVEEALQPEHASLWMKPPESSAAGGAKISSGSLYRNALRNVPRTGSE